MSDSNASQKDEENDPCKEPVKKCPHEFCHRDQIESDKPIGLPWASGRLVRLPGDPPLLDEPAPCCPCKKKEKRKKSKKGKKKVCNCKCKPKKKTKCDYPKYIDLCNNQQVQEELDFFLKSIVLGDRHYLKELVRIEEEAKAAKKAREKCLGVGEEAEEEGEKESEKEGEGSVEGSMEGEG